MGSMSQTLTSKTFNPIAVTTLANFFQFLHWSLVLCWFPLPSVTTPDCLGSLLPCGFCSAIHSCAICSLKHHNTILPIETFLLRLPLWVGPHALAQPYGLLSQVEDMLCSYHHTSSMWNHTPASEAHEEGNPLSVFEHCLHSTWWAVPTALHSLLPPIGLHIASLSLSFFVVSCKDATVPYTSSNLYIISVTGACRPRYQIRSTAAPCKDCLFPPSMLPLCDLASHFSLQKPIAQMRLPPLGGVSTEYAKFGHFTLYLRGYTGQEILHCGSGIGLGNCMFVPSTDTLSFLPTQHNWSQRVICSGVATLHLVFTLWHNHMSMDHKVLQNFSISSPSIKTNKVFFSFSLCSTIGSTVVCSYTNPAMMSWFVHAGDNTCPHSNSIIKN